ncbi:Methionine aminopeptidase OS=Tsukamurella paurometabola (strain ATCC 8368 / DSM / CCUG 35730/ CIP 100753 / JCM 10117 / KCTC 9821 / NBRC 16120 / NCIMB 702349/ NCTC 13040) OX=521096 GN=map PE=3 SV=1 [Tsukamurella paurometabola]|uniref:Methionine aminopeptidase n=1 Tax=Tsukamurella paurometabola (strain ATCC 8368 / DSM 20162 / CCUG 35730 / CIP 100753 / JCM 10117 / KCTC 9821 / NBRC 16120 / NCIMB 702349 / NCTC 13040) TaxID=521096 RepID=D5UU24_TSUPD|nr:type I methionyl aminopeptidase [Tsukamurella paurometabola]ADG79527.1 methionine aminopeptidase, type I [Tsukamurella paurometabola DSM 20162]SUP36099.1 Methionine aminopeptidase 1 [Tsukamurella paurometabola]
MMELKTPGEIEKMRTTGAFIAQLLEELTTMAEPGMNLMELEYRARKMIDDRGAQSCYWDYAPSFGRGPFRNVTCLSVNDACLHGLPHEYVFEDGDLLTVDIAVSIDGWVADAARSVSVGTPRPEDTRLIQATRDALDAAIDHMRPGTRLGTVSASIGEVAKKYGYPVNTQFGGHGLGRTMHEDPHVPNTGKARKGLLLQTGTTLALEPWFCATTDKITFDPDGWTLRSADGSRAAHSEHTVAITEDGPRILTAPA